MKKLLIITTALLALTACNDGTKAAPVADSGVKKTSVKLKTGADGLSVEQRNVKQRLIKDNQIGSLKHLYVISAYTGDVLIYSTVKGKVTSSGKRLTNTHKLVRGDRGQGYGDFVMPSIQDDGTYGSSSPYVYWFDSKGVYHQHYIMGGQIFHVSDKPLRLKSKPIINMELSS